MDGGGKEGASNWHHKTKEQLLNHLDAIVNQIIEANLDVLVLNEVDFSTAWSHNVNQVRYIAKKSGFPFVLEQKSEDVSFPFFRICCGNAVLSKFPITDEFFIDFEPLSCLEDVFFGNHDGAFCKINTRWGDMGLLAVHLEWRDETTRVKSAKKLIEISSSMRIPFIAMGDFNSSPIGFSGSKLSKNEENTMTILLGQAEFLSYLESYDEKAFYTFPSERPNRVLDWIVGKNIQGFINAGKIVSDLSDHLMILAEVEF